MLFIGKGINNKVSGVNIVFIHIDKKFILMIKLNLYTYLSIVLFQNYGRGTSKDCRNHVQKLNEILITSEETPFAALNGNLNYTSNQQGTHHDSYDLYEDTENQHTECSFSLLSDDNVNECEQNLPSDKHYKYKEHQDFNYNVDKNSDLSLNSESNCNNVSRNISQANVNHCLVSVSTSDSTPPEGSSTLTSLTKNCRSDFKHKQDESVNIPSSSGITEINEEKFPLPSGCLR